MAVRKHTIVLLQARTLRLPTVKTTPCSSDCIVYERWTFAVVMRYSSEKLPKPEIQVLQALLVTTLAASRRTWREHLRKSCPI